MSSSPLPATTRVDFELVLRYRASQHALIGNERDRLLAGEAPRSSAGPADRSADPADIKAVTSFATSAGFHIVEVDEAARRVRLSGPAALINRTFHVTLVTRSAGARSWRDCDGEPAVPAELQPMVEAVLGLSEKPAASH
jgi:kumamolisin